MERRAVIGWKIVVPARPNRRTHRCGRSDGQPPLGGTRCQDGAAVPLGANHMRVSPRLRSRMGLDLPPCGTFYETDEVLAAGCEDSAVLGAPQLFADNACARLFVLGLKRL